MLIPNLLPDGGDKGNNVLNHLKSALAFVGVIATIMIIRSLFGH